MRPVVLDHAFKDVKIANIVGLMNLAVIMREVQVRVLLLVLEFRVKLIKIARQVNTVLERITKYVPEGALRKRVKKMAIASLDNVVATTGNVHLGHATQNGKAKVELVGELQSAYLHLLLLQLSVYALVAVRGNEKPPGN
mgnify:CR=1 FL=1